MIPCRMCLLPQCKSPMSSSSLPVTWKGLGDLYMFLPTATDKMEDDLVLLFLFANGCKLFCESLMCFTGGNVNGFRTSCNSIINKDLL